MTFVSVTASGQATETMVNLEKVAYIWRGPDQPGGQGPLTTIVFVEGVQPLQVTDTPSDIVGRAAPAPRVWTSPSA